MARSGNQTEKGKAFEFACAQTVFEKAQGLIDVELQRNSPLLTASVAVVGSGGVDAEEIKIERSTKLLVEVTPS